MSEPVKTTIRLSDEDQANVEKIISSGAAQNISEAVRVALADFARTAPRMKAIERTLAEIRGPMTKLPKDQVVAYAAAEDPTLKDVARRELLARGLFPDGLGNWVENRPDMSVFVPATPITKGPPTRVGKR